VNRNGLRLALLSAALAAASLLALPGGAGAFQTIRIEGGTLFITGDVGKTPDEVTIRFDSVKNEYVIGHDVDMIAPPPGCTFEGGGPPYKIMHCPAPGITRIRIDLATDKDKVIFENMIDKGLAPNFAQVVPDTYVPIELVSISVNLGPGNDKFDGGGMTVIEDPTPDADGNPAEMEIDLGVGIDVASVESGSAKMAFGGSGKLTISGGENEVTFVESAALFILGGLNTIAVGEGTSKATVSDGQNTVTFGAGNSVFAASAGTNVVTFGPGNSVFTGGSGNDSAFFGPGPGNNSFSGGGGSDSVSLGPGNDTAAGGPGGDLLRGGPGKEKLRGEGGADTLFGGPGKDVLFGGPAFDRLFGGPGMDLCFPGGPGIEVSCP
jgi:Ca2+-binding RTX toxin-like protein